MAAKSAVLDAAIGRIEHILGPREHPDTAAVIDTVADALNAQAALIAREMRREAAAYRSGQMPAAGNQQLTYDGGLRRAARIAQAHAPKEHR